MASLLIEQPLPQWRSWLLSLCNNRGVQMRQTCKGVIHQARSLVCFTVVVCGVL